MSHIHKKWKTSWVEVLPTLKAKIFYLNNIKFHGHLEIGLATTLVMGMLRERYPSQQPWQCGDGISHHNSCAHTVLRLSLGNICLNMDIVLGQVMVTEMTELRDIWVKDNGAILPTSDKWKDWQGRGLKPRIIWKPGALLWEPGTWVLLTLLELKDICLHSLLSCPFFYGHEAWTLHDDDSRGGPQKCYRHW